MAITQESHPRYRRPLRLVSHYLPAEDVSSPKVVPTSHPAYQFSASSSSSSSGPSSHAHHVSSQIQVDAENGSSCLIIARVLDSHSGPSSSTLQVKVMPLSPGGADYLVPTSLKQTDSLPAQYFIFPAPLLPSSSLLLDSYSGQLHIVAVTVTGWLYRLQLPIPGTVFTSNLQQSWVDEHEISSLSSRSSGEGPASSWSPGVESELTMAHAVESGMVLVACQDGSLVKVEQGRSSDGSGKFSGPWRESVLRSTSFLKNFSKFFSRANSGSATADTISTSSLSANALLQTVAVDALFQQDAAALAFSISRDRKLRVWDLISNACLRTMDLPAQLADEDNSDGLPQPFGTTGATRPIIRLVQPTDEEETSYAVYALVFIPAPLPSGSFWALYGIELPSPATSRAVVSRSSKNANTGSSSGGLGDIDLLWQKGCDEETRHLRAELRDVNVTVGHDWGLWSLWDVAGAIRVKFDAIHLDDDELDEIHDGSSSMTVGQSNPYSDFHSTELDGVIAQQDPAGIAAAFASQIFEAGRFSTATIEWALRAYRTKATYDFPIETQHLGLAARVCAVVGSDVSLETDLETGALRYDRFQLEYSREWRRFVGLLETAESQGWWPLQLVRDIKSTKNLPLVITRERLCTLLDEDLAETTARLSQAEGVAQRSLQLQIEHHVANLDDFIQSCNADATTTGDPRRDEIAFACFELSKIANQMRFLPVKEFSEQVAAVVSRPLEADLLDVLMDAFESSYGSELDETLTSAISEALGRLAQTKVAVVLESGQTIADDVAWERSVLEPAFWALADILAAPIMPSVSHKSVGQARSTTLAASLTADGLYHTLRTREALARSLLSLSLLVYASQDEITVAFDRLPALIVRLVSLFHSTSVLVRLADQPVGPEERSKEGAHGEDDAFALRMGRMQMDSSGAGANTASLLSTSMLHECISNGILHAHILPEEGLQADISTMTESILASMGLPRALGGAWTKPLTHADIDVPRMPREVAELSQALLSRGQLIAGQQIAEAYPASPVTAYLLARSSLLSASFDSAADAFEAAVPDILALNAGSEESSVLLSLMPPQVQTGSTDSDAALAQYYLHVTDAFASAGADTQVAHFARLALSSGLLRETLDGPTRQHMAFYCFRAEVALEQYALAYSTMMSMGGTSGDAEYLLRRDCLRTLVSVMCERGQIAELLSYNFAGLQSEVERNLSFKARNSDPTSAGPNYYHILYSYHVQRGDFTSAGAVMYQQALRLGEVYRMKAVTGAPVAMAERFVDVAVQQARCLLASMNALSLLDAKNAWFADAVGRHQETVAGSMTESTGASQGLSSFIPAEHWQSSSKELRIVKGDAIRREYYLVLARLELVQVYPELAGSTMILSAGDAVALYIRNEQFQRAFTSARELGVSQDGIFTALAVKCAHTAHKHSQQIRGLKQERKANDPDGINEETNKALDEILHDGFDDESEVLTDDVSSWAFLRSDERTSSWTGSISALAWRYLKYQLDVSDTKQKDEATHRLVVLNRLLTLALEEPDETGQLQTTPIEVPQWLVEWFEQHRPDLLIRAYMRVNQLDKGLGAAVKWIRASTKEIKGLTSSDGRSKRERDETSYLPFLLFDNLLEAVEARSDATSAVMTLAKDLKAEVEARTGLLRRQWREMLVRDEEEEARRAKGRGERMEWD